LLPQQRRLSIGLYRFHSPDDFHFQQNLRDHQQLPPVKIVLLCEFYRRPRQRQWQRLSFAGLRMFAVERREVRHDDVDILRGNQKVDWQQTFVDAGSTSEMCEMLQEQKWALFQSENNMLVVAASSWMRHCRWVFEMDGSNSLMETRSRFVGYSKDLLIEMLAVLRTVGSRVMRQAITR
jgi:hypothetical protein